MEGFRYSTDVVVRFAETDAQGIAHHAAFVVWLEVARVGWLAEHAGGYRAIQAQGIEALTTEVHVRYHRAAHFDVLVVANKLDCLFEIEYAGRYQPDRLIRCGRAHVRQLLLFDDIHVEVRRAKEPIA